jgi:hypothetical protein
VLPILKTIKSDFALRSGIPPIETQLHDYPDWIDFDNLQEFANKEEVFEQRVGFLGYCRNPLPSKEWPLLKPMITIAKATPGWDWCLYLLSITKLT